MAVAPGRSEGPLPSEARPPRGQLREARGHYAEATGRPEQGTAPSGAADHARSA